jgi:WD40 repeat protein
MQLNFCITIAHDQAVKIHDATNGAAFYARTNGNRCRFAHVGWGLARQELYLVDDAGCLQIWNVYTNKCVHMARLRSGVLTGVTVLAHDRLLVCSPDGAEIWHIARLTQVRDFRGHEAPILRLVWLDEQRLVSASLDNTVRGWSPQDMSGGVLLRERKSEISCMVRAPAADASALFTGHQDGAIRLWNADTGACVTLAQHHADAVTGVCVRECE